MLEDYHDPNTHYPSNPNIGFSQQTPDSSYNWPSWFDAWNDYAGDTIDNNIFSTQGEIAMREWARQMMSTMYQNWYNSAPNQMALAQQAGINPFVAASGISGSGSGSVASVNPSPIQSPVLSALGSAASASSALGGTFGNIASGVATFAKLVPEIRKIDSETSNIFEQMGFTHLQSNAMSLQLKYLDQKEQIGVWQALASFDKTKAEYQNLLATHRNILAQYDEIIAHKDLLVQEKGEVQAREEYEKAMKDKISAETTWQNIENQFFTAHGYKLGTPLYEGLRDMMVSDGSFDMDSFGNVVAEYKGKITKAVEDSKAAASWDYRPSNVSEAAAYIGSHLGQSLRDVILSCHGVKSWNELYTKIRSNSAASSEFEQNYKDAREDLYENYLSKKRYYRNIRRGGNTQEVARAKMAMDNAEKEYRELTKEKFGMQLLSELSKIN